MPSRIRASPLTISDVMESIPVGSTRRINRRRGEGGPLGQPRFFGRAPRTVRQDHERAEGIHLNPVKADIAPRVEDGPGSSVHYYTGSLTQSPRPAEILAIDHILLPADERV